MSGRDIEEKNTQRRADLLGLNYLDIRTLVKKPLYEDLISKEHMHEYQVVPIVSSDQAMTFGITTMTPPDILQELRQLYNQKRVRYVLISNTAFLDYYQLYNPPQVSIYKDITLDSNFDPKSLQAMSEAFNNVKADDILAYLVDQAFRLKASDIHCENNEHETLIRLRVHGVLYPIVSLQKNQYRILLSAIASAANLSTSANDAQTGHIGQTHQMDDGRKVNMNLRVETIPAMHGMDVVMRFFSFDEDHLQLNKLGMSAKQIKIVDDIIKYPRGLVLIVGPTGSGKTTTLYSLIHALRSPQLKIITLEDPVEYKLKDITQIPIDSYKGASFAKGLRTVLRLDPDIVMVGEIRDDDTAQTALHAALTGHLVMSTYHAATTALALVTLLQIMRDNPLFLNAIRLIQAQRLVRRLDDKTKQAYSPSDVQKAQINKILQTIPSNNRPTLPADYKLFKPVPSDENPFGYSGQLAIRELLVLDDELRTFLLKEGEHIGPAKLEDYLRSSGKLITMLQEGVMRVLRGETTLEELYRTGA